jgi:hypothetical protein
MTLSITFDPSIHRGIRINVSQPVFFHLLPFLAVSWVSESRIVYGENAAIKIDDMDASKACSADIAEANTITLNTSAPTAPLCVVT